jgi:hypothetical protein
VRPLPPSVSRPLPRRTVHGALVGALVVPLTGCDLLPRSSPATPAPPTADELLVERVTTALRAARDVAAGAPHGLPVVAVHDAHLAALGSSAATPSTSASAGSRQAPSADLRTTELALQTTLTEAAGQARDGDLARLLASMAASVAQQVAVLPAGKVAR